MFSTHTQSTHWDTEVEAKHLNPNAKFINVSQPPNCISLALLFSSKYFFVNFPSSKQMSNRPTSSMPGNESELVNDCRRALTNGKLKNPMDHIRLLCLSRGASGIYNLGR